MTRYRLVTVAARVRALGYRGEEGKRIAWAVGRAIRDLWQRETGARPQMELVRKTSGGGTHQKAVYPETWQARIDAAIEREAADQRAEPTHTGQTSLF